MKPDRKLALVEALRSDKYGQCRQQLKNSVGNYCCLGVACEISGLGRWTETRAYCTEEYSSETKLPHDLAVFYGLSVDEQYTLMRLNDSEGWTFERIAQYIEENF